LASVDGVEKKEGQTEHTPKLVVQAAPINSFT